MPALAAAWTSTGFRAVVEDGTTGILFPTTDVEALADATVRLAQNDPLRTAIGRQARERAAAHRAFGPCIGACANHIWQLANGARCAPAEVGEAPARAVTA